MKRKVFSQRNGHKADKLVARLKGEGYSFEEYFFTAGGQVQYRDGNVVGVKCCSVWAPGRNMVEISWWENIKEADVAIYAVI